MDKFKRHLLFVRPDYILLFDDIQSQIDGLQWHLHTDGDLSLNGESAVTDAPRAAMLMRFAASCPLASKIGTYYEGAKRLTSNLTLMPEAGVKSLWIAALLIPFPKLAVNGVSSSLDKPSVESLALSDGVQFRVQGAWGEDTITVIQRREDIRLLVSGPGQNHITVIRRFLGRALVTFQIVI